MVFLHGIRESSLFSKIENTLLVFDMQARFVLCGFWPHLFVFNMRRLPNGEDGWHSFKLCNHIKFAIESTNFIVSVVNRLYWISGQHLAYFILFAHIVLKILICVANSTGALLACCYWWLETFTNMPQQGEGACVNKLQICLQTL